MQYLKFCQTRLILDALKGIQPFGFTYMQMCFSLPHDSVLRRIASRFDASAFAHDPLQGGGI
jgi:hypothetical protein